MTRFLIVALGLLGFVLFPGAGPGPNGVGIGVRTGAAQPLPAHATPGRGRSTEVRRSEQTPVRTHRVAVVKAAQQAGALAPGHGPGPAVEPSPPGIAEHGTAATRPAEPATSFLATAPDGPPRGRAPPLSMDF